MTQQLPQFARERITQHHQEQDMEQPNTTNSQPGTVNHTYIGTKRVQGWAMTRAAYNDYRGWTLPADEDGADEGYLVEYLDGGKPNDARHAGYISWSPKEQFDTAYRRCDAMTFGLAVEAMMRGNQVARAGWNGKGLFVYLVPANAYFALKGVDNTVSTWAPSVSDALAEDWVILTHLQPAA